MFRHSTSISSALLRTWSKSSAISFTAPVMSAQRYAPMAPSTMGMSTSTSPKKETKSPSLPRLPVPALNDTLTKYLRTVKPLLSPEAFQKTTQIVKNFGTDPELGPKLQGLLENRANSMDNWMADWWLNTAYLEYRQPVIVFSSPGLVFPLQIFNSLNDQLSYASKMIYGALTYKEMIDEGKIKQDFMGKIPLDMSQYQKIFGTTRNPKKPRDELTYHPKSQHIIVAFKNYFFKVDILKSGKLRSPSDFQAELNSIVENTSGLSGIPIGLLTSMDRDSWSDVYGQLKQDPQNAKSLKTIEEGLFIISLDGPNRAFSSEGKSVPQEVEDVSLSERQTMAALQMLHGNTTNSGNRWFDKTISFIVGTEGNVGLTYEHSPAEGPPIANMMDFIVQQSEGEILKGKSISKSGADHNPLLLEFNLKDKSIIQAIGNAKRNTDALIQDVQMSAFTFRKYGREFIKSCALSPDSFIQTAIQAAFYQLHRVPAAHYESASVRMYSGGRTECIRSCSMDALQFSKALLDSSMPLQVKFQALKSAVESHKKYAADAIKGEGVDRHLLGLKKIAMENGMNVPDLFGDEAFSKSSNFRLSTSQVPSLFEAFMCYGPLTSDGYGCCYNPLKNSIVFGISAFNSNPETDANKFKTALQETLLEMEKVGSMSSMQSKL